MKNAIVGFVLGSLVSVAGSFITTQKRASESGEYSKSLALTAGDAISLRVTGSNPIAQQTFIIPSGKKAVARIEISVSLNDL